MEHTSCILCGRSAHTAFMTLKDRLDPTGTEDFSLVRCDCGFIYLDPRPTEDEISRYYASPDYDPHRDQNRSMFDSAYVLVQKIALGMKYRRILRYHTRGSLLDIGGGKGEFCEYMSRKGWQTTLQDKSHPVLDSARSRGLRSVNSLSDLSAREQFDLVTLWHALEHIHDTEAVFESIDHHLHKKGHLIIAVPNHDAPERKWYGKQWAPYDAPRHLYHFTQDTLQAFLRKKGYSVVSKFSLPQDTAYNILLSMHTRSLKNIFYAGLILVNSLAISVLFGTKKASSIVLVCKKN